MSYFKKVFKNVVASWTNLAVSLLISFFLSPFVLHKIGDFYFGIWALISQVTGYLWLLDFGVRDSVVKYVAEYHSKDNKGMLNDIINASLKMYSIICFACIAVTAALAFLFPSIFSISGEAITVARALVIITGLDIAQTFVFNVFIGILMGLQRYDLFSKIAIVLSIVRAGLLVAFLSHGYGIVTLCLIQFFTNSCTNIIIYAFSIKLLPFKVELRKHGREKDMYRTLMNFSFYVFLNNIGQQAIFYSSNLIIGLFLPISRVTYFAIAVTLVEHMKKIIWAGSQVFSPLTSELEAKNESSKITIVLVQGTRFSLLIGLPIATVYLFLGRQFIGLWLGFEYASLTGGILSILSVMTLFSLPHYTISGILMGLNKHWIMAYCRMGEAMVNIGLSVLLIRRYGVLGAALGAAIPHLIMVLFILPIVISRIMNIGLLEYLRSSYFGPLFSAVPFAFACFLVPSFYIPQSLIAFVGEVIALLPIYGVGIWFVAFTKRERRVYRDRVIALVPGTLGR